MTPDAVLKRYIELVSNTDIDAASLYPVIALDADLLGRWMATLGCAVEPRAIERGLEDLGVPGLAAMARTQIWAVVPAGSGARLGFEQWRAVLLASCLAESLLTRADYRDAESARLRILLAGSGIQIASDPLMAELAEFRGAEPALLVDAHPALRAFAVSEALEHHGRAQAAAVAAELFAVDAAAFASVFTAAEEHAASLIGVAGIQLGSAEDWFPSLWAQAQLAAISVVLGRQADSPALQDHGRRIGRALFSHEPRVFLLDRSGGALSGTGSDDLATLRLKVATSPSIAAAVVRERRAVGAEDGPSVAVTDRQVMRRLGAERIHAMPLVAGSDVVGVVIFKVTEEDAAELPVLMAGYAAELGFWLGELRRRDEALGMALGAYRALHEKRLREIVHEANNPLSIINNYLHILELRLKDHPETHEQLRLVAAEIRRAATIMRKVVEFPSAEEVRLAAPSHDFLAVDLNALARSVVGLIRDNAASAGVEVQLALQEDGATITSDPDRITQVLTNLVRNALEAMNAGGMLTLESFSRVYRAGRVGAELVVRDTGPGLPEDVLAVLYAPKHSRKGGEHSGLGLHITARLVEELDGAIDVRTSGRGTTFSVFLSDLATTR